MGRLSSLLVGGVLGAGLAMLLSPNTGSEAQTALRRRARDLTDRYGDAIEKGRIRATELVKSGRDVLDEQLPRVNELLNTAAEKARPLMDQIQQQAGQLTQNPANTPSAEQKPAIEQKDKAGSAASPEASPRTTEQKPV